MKPATEIKTLTGLRGFAAIWVALFHFRYATTPDIYFKIFDNKLFEKGNLAVDIFFVLSGFVLAYATQNWNGERPFLFTLQFLRSRLARIYPLHVATLLIMIFAVDSKFSGADIFKSALGQLALVHAWGHLYFPDLNYPSWSLSAEWAAYLLFPILLLSSRIIGRKPVLAVASCLISAFALAYLGAKYMNGKCDFTWDWGWARCLSEFWIGLFVFQAYRYCDQRFKQTTRNAWAIATLILFAGYIKFAGVDAWIIPVSALLVFTFSLEPAILKRVFANRISHRVGEISFSIYMLHVPIGLTLMRFTSAYPRLYASTVGGVATVTFVLLVLLTASSLTYQYFEMPMKRWLSRRSPALREVGEIKSEKLAS